MFVYLLIAAELAVLYTVFWYLYVREPQEKRRISANLWGTYEESLVDGRVDPTLPFLCHHEEEHQIYQGAYPAQVRQYILDLSTNHYVPVVENATMLNRVADSLDRTFSQLNIKQ
jgi:hypothetical protein